MGNIDRKSLDRRVYDGRDCVEFSLKVNFTRDLTLDFKFSKVLDNEPSMLWSVSTVIPSVGAFGPIVVAEAFSVFKKDQPLEFIAEVGLRKLNMTVFQVMADMMAMNSGISELLGEDASRV